MLLQSWLRDTRKTWLVILDNVDDAAFLEATPTASDKVQSSKRRIDYFPSHDHGSLLITSRTKDEALKLVQDTEMIHVGVMNEAEAEELLERTLERSSPDNSTLARALDCIPLAISQAAAYIRRMGKHYSTGKYHEQIQRSRQTRSSLLQQSHPDLNRDEDSRNSIALTWQISFEHLLDGRKSAADLLALMSFCDRVAIPESLLLARAANHDFSNDSSDGAFCFREDIAVLLSFSFISETETEQTWEMHRLVQEAMHIWLNAQNVFEDVRDMFIRCLDKSFLKFDYRYAQSLQAAQKLFPHAKMATQYRLASNNALLELASIMHNSALYLNERRRHIEALEMARASRDVRTTQLGRNNDLTAMSIEMMARMFWHQRQYQEAESFQRMALEINEGLLEAEDPVTLSFMNNLGLILRDSGRLEEAEVLFKRVYEISQAKFGEEFPGISRSLGNLAATLSYQKRWKEAEEFHAKALRISQAVFGTKHPDTIHSMRLSAWIFAEQGKWVEAEALQLEGLALAKEVYGMGHPNMYRYMNNLGFTYDAQRRWPEAEELYTQALEGFQKTLGLQHPDTLTAIRRLELIQRKMPEQATHESSEEKTLPDRSKEAQPLAKRPHGASDTSEQQLRKRHERISDEIRGKKT